MKLIVRLTGGLGNQMFQYAAARMLAEKYKAELFYDASYYKKQPKKDTPRRLELEQFNIRAKENSQYLFFMGFFNFYIKVKNKLAKYSIRIPKVRGVITSENFSFIQEPKSKCLYMIGHFQDKDIVDLLGNELVNDFQLKPALIKMINDSPIYRIIKESKGCVALHIRRGDYITNTYASKHHGVSSLSYYINALNYLSSICEFEDIIVFSDEPKWARDNLKYNKNIYFCDSSNSANSNDYSSIDLYLMSQCHHFIIANSTYSWWAAWLGQHPSKNVVAPSRWNVNNSVFPIPSNWKKIDE